MTIKSITEFWRPRAALGLTIGASAVRAVRLARSETGLRIEGRTVVEFPLDRRPHPAEIESALSEAAASLIDEKTRIVAGLTAQTVGLHLFDLPFDRPDKVRRVLRYEAEPLFLTPVEELVLDYLPLSTGGVEDRRGLVFGARPEHVSMVIEDFAAAGLDPELVLPDRLGLIAVGRSLFQERGFPPLGLIIDLGGSQTSLAAYRHGQLSATRSIFYGGRDITRTLAETLNLDQDQAEALKRRADLAGGDPAVREAVLKAWTPLLVEISRTLAAASQGVPDQTPILILTGGGALTPGLDRFLSERLNLETSRLQDFQDQNPVMSDLTPDLVPAFGLAWLGLNEEHQPNLRQGTLAPQRTWSRYRVPLTLMTAGLILVFLLNLGNLIYTFQVRKAEHQAIKARIESLFKETVPTATKIVAPVVQLRQELEKVQSSAAGFDPARGKVLDLLLEVSQMAGTHQELRITNLALTPQTLELQGEGGSFEVIDRFKNELAALPFFSEAALGGARLDPVARVLTFKISLKRQAG